MAKWEDASLLLIHEQAGRTVARQQGLQVTGTIGVVGAAAERRLVDPAEAADALRNTTFRASPDLYRWLLRRQVKD